MQVAILVHVWRIKAKQALTILHKRWRDELKKVLLTVLTMD